MKKTINGIIIGLLLVVGAVGAYLYFSSPKADINNKKEESKTENKEELKKEEYYQFYFENGKIYYSLNKGEKKYLMDNINKDKTTDNYLYDADKLFYYTMDTNYNGDIITGYKYNFSYIDLNTKKKSENFANLEVDVEKQIHVRKINNNKVYYAYGKVIQLNSEAKVGVDEYSFKTKETKNILEKTITGKVGGGGYIPPIVEVDEDTLFIQAMDDRVENIYKVENGKEEIIVSDVVTSAVDSIFNILNDKLYYIDSDLLFSYDINKGTLKKESEPLTSYFGNALVFSDMIAYITKTGSLYVKTNDAVKVISLKLDGNICTNCTDLYLTERIDENELGIASSQFSSAINLNLVTTIPESYGGGFIVNVSRMTERYISERYLEFER